MRSTPDAVMLKLSHFLPDQKIPTFSKDTLFIVLCVTDLGFFPTLFSCLCVQPHLLSDHLRQLRFCRHLFGVMQIPGTFTVCPATFNGFPVQQRYISHLHFHKGYSRRTVMHFPIHKGYYGSRASRGVSHPIWL